MDNQDPTLDSDLTNDDPQGLKITSEIRKYWKESTQWGLFFAVLGFLYVGLLLLGLLSSNSLTGFGFGLFTLMLMGGFVFLPTWLIFQFSQKVKKALDTDHTAPAEEGFTQLRYLYQFIGILTIVGLSVYVLAFLFSLLLLSRGG